MLMRRSSKRIKQKNLLIVNDVLFFPLVSLTKYIWKQRIAVDGFTISSKALFKTVYFFALDEISKTQSQS